jgi:hypothetical protein
MTGKSSGDRRRPCRPNLLGGEAMRKHLTAVGAVMLGVGLLALPGLAQQKKKRLSPAASASCQFANGQTIHVNYSSPRMRGRKIYGGLVPYNKVWRLGANEATTFDISTSVVIDGKEVPKGNYTLFTIPTPDRWTLIISKKTGEWGIPYPGEQYDFARLPMTVSHLSSPLEDLTISFVPTGNVCTMHVDWERTRASIKITEKK